MENGKNQKAPFPAGLLNWAGHRSGGVKRLFQLGGGRPTGEVIFTPLLVRLQSWAKSLAVPSVDTPRAVLLVGGPGNGKTEAVEYTIFAIDESLGLSGALVNELARQFLADDDHPTPRLARIDLGRLSAGRYPYELCIVQDASAECPGQSPPSLLLQDLEEHVAGTGNVIYLACVNRGILDDALILAIDQKRDEIQHLLEVVVRSVGMGAEAPACWPLEGYPTIAAWPMDVETLVEPVSAGQSAAAQLLELGTAPRAWPVTGSCPARERCPFCTSRALLASEPHRTSLLTILRWYELASGKRWTFRDLFSLFSFLLAGVPPDGENDAYNDPCEWAARLLALRTAPPRPQGKHEAIRLSAPFVLVASQYQHALFGSWPRHGLREFRECLKELQLQEDPVLLGFYHFLNDGRRLTIPSTLAAQLPGLVEALDPATADPDLLVEVSARTTIRFRDIDTRFSQSVTEGLRFIQKYQCLTQLEVDLLKLLATADEQLSIHEVRRRRPAIAARVQALLRDFACRLARRALGARGACVRDNPILADYQKVVRGDETLLHDSARQVQLLLNKNERFLVTLNTTFGEPSPPPQRRVVLSTSKQKVRPKEVPSGERPSSALRFLSVGTGSNVQSIPLTYELFKSVRELRMGMTPASLPRTVVALLDTTRARLAGRIVRDEDSLDDGEIQIGTREDIIARGLDGFLVQPGSAE